MDCCSDHGDDSSLSGQREIDKILGSDTEPDNLSKRDFCIKKVPLAGNSQFLCVLGVRSLYSSIIMLEVMTTLYGSFELFKFLNVLIPFYLICYTFSFASLVSASRFLFVKETVWAFQTISRTSTHK